MSLDCFTRSLLQIDFIGREPRLKINGAPRNQTIIGGILCILIYCIFILCALYFGQELVYRVLPKIIESTEIVDKDDTIAVGKDKFNFFFSILDKDSQYHYPSELVSSKLKMVKVSNNIKENEGNTKNEKEIKLKQCDSSDFALRQKDTSYKRLDLSKWMCIDIDDSDNNNLITANGNYENYSYLKLKINDCEGEECKEQDERVKIVENSVFILKYFDFQFNHREFNDYYSDMIFEEKIIMDFNFRKETLFTLEQISFKTDIGYMFEDFREKKFHNVKSIKEFVHLNDNTETDSISMSLYFQLGTRKHINYRKYYKFQNWVAELGGIVRALTLVASVINYFNDKSSYYQLMINKLFDVDDVIKYFQYSDNSNNKIKKRDSIILLNAKKEKDYFERGVFEKKKNNSISPLHKTLNNYVKKDSKGSKEKDSLLAKNTTNVNNTNNALISENNNAVREASSFSSENDNDNIDQHELYLEALKNNQTTREHFEKVKKKKRFTLNMFESFVYCFSVKKENPKYNAYYGGRVLITERSDIIYLLKKNLELERFKNLILRDNQLLLLNSLTKFLLDPERVNLLDFEKCSYDKFIDFYDNIATNASMIDIKLSKWVETKYKIEHINTYNNNNNN